VFTALLDTNVLWPSLLRDFLLSLAIEGLYRPVWSETILAELEYHEAAKLVGRGMARTEADLRSAWLVAQMREHFDDALVTGWEGLDGTYGLPDPDDEHVLAAAVVGAAGVIVTYNVKDFPASKVPAGIDVLAPEVFAHTTVSLDPPRAMVAVNQIAARSGTHGPPRTAEEILDLLVSRYRLHDAVACLREGS